MKSERAIEILQRQQTATTELKTQKFSPQFTKWDRDTQIAIEKIFGKDSRNISDFNNISYTLGAFSSSTPQHKFDEAYVRGLDQAAAILESMIEEIREYGSEGADSFDIPSDMALIEKLCLRFHAAARQLQSRYSGRATIGIDDEYDVQDLLHAFLRLHFDDIRPEEWTPSYAGRPARVDFLLKKERIVIEVKKTRRSMKAGDLGEELIIDRARYEGHPDCDTLVCFVYDPEGRIGNPRGIEHDLENHTGNLKVRVIIAPK